MRFKNETDQQVFIAMGKGITVPPGGEIDIEDGYALPRRADNGSRRPSIIESLAPQLKPADPAERAVWEQAPQRGKRGAAPLGGMPTVEGLMAAGVPKGVAEGLVRSALEAALAAIQPAGAEAGSKKPAATGEKK